MELNELRNEINDIDDRIKALFLQRMDVSSRIAHLKRASGLPVLDRTREREVLARLTSGMEPPMDSYTRSLFTTLFGLSRALQASAMAGEGELAAGVRAAMASGPRRLPASAAVACQGTEGAYSQIACDKLFSGASIMYMDSFEGVARAVESGLCSYGMLPIENNIHGSVIAVYDLMRRHSFRIVRSIKLRVDHCLAALPGAALDGVREVFTHEQAVGQCGRFLRAHPGMRVTVCSNTAVAAKQVAASGRTDAAAICSADCCALYGLTALARDIQDSQSNYTRFICISRDMQVFEGADRVSIMFRAPHSPGALCRVLSPLAAAGLNVTKLESRPIPGHDFDFLFYADIACDCREEGALAALGSLASCTDELTLLGAYSEA